MSSKLSPLSLCPGPSTSGRAKDKIENKKGKILKKANVEMCMFTESRAKSKLCRIYFLRIVIVEIEQS
jgi:hypothetical protein